MSIDSRDFNPQRRRFLTGAVVAVGGVGAAFAAVPFIVSWEPSERALAIGAPVEVDISKLEPGQLIRVKWQGKPVFVVNRTKQALASLKGDESKLRDPTSAVDQQPPYAHNEYRSIKPEYLVVVGICTHLGCSPTYRPDIAPADLGPTWEGGFFCPCHGSRFDLAGRVFESVPAPTNLVVPPYEYLSPSRILIGVGPTSA